MFRMKGGIKDRRRAGLVSWPVFAVALLLGWMGMAGSASAQTQQWHRWEKELRTSRDYHQVLVNGVLEKDNPYRKLTIRVTYSPVNCAVSTPWCQAFAGYGFWDGGRVFKIRASFPAGTWNYTVSCSGQSGGSSTAPLDCSSGDPVLNQSGTVVVENTVPGESDLFERGFVRRSTSSGLKYLTYGDETPFHWRADTAWSAASVGKIDNATAWSTFLSDRASKGFTVVMMGVAPDGDNTGNATGVLWDDVPQTGAGCTGVAWPKPCSRWRPEFWRKFEEKIRVANEAGLLVVLIGLMDPQGNAQGSTLYPDANAAALFARNLAARLEGDHVIFSPSFDDRLSTTRALMDTVGNSLRDAAPRHLITAHLAGSSNICDYYDMHNTAKHPWHQIHIFQSGHALNRNDCASIEDDYECAMRRARNMPDLLSPTPTSPPSCADPTQAPPTSTNVKPNANGEAAYDNTLTRSSVQTVDSPYGVRHSGYNSALNGAFGVTLGVLGIWTWDNVSAATLGSDGSRQMKILGDQFSLNPWQMLQRRSPRIKYQPADSEQDKKMTLAATLDNNFALAYLPDNSDFSFDASFLSGFSCDPAGPWSIQWIDPKTGNLFGGTPACTPLTGDPQGATHRLTRPNCANPATAGPLGDCDWLIKLRRKGTFGALASFSAASLDVWTAPTDDGSGWIVQGRRQDTGETFAISEPSGKRLKLPVVAGEGVGSFVVVWESEDDGSLHGIFLRRVNGQGQLLDHEYRVNRTTEYDQTNPWVALDPAGRGGVVAWTSYAQDGDSGGIFARLLNPAGVPQGQEIQVNETAAGRQDFSKVAMDAQGRFLVAWTSYEDGDAEGVYARRFDDKGRPLGPELRVNTTVAGAQWLTNVELTAEGDFLVTWTSYAPDGQELGILGQRFGSGGLPVGGETMIVPPPAAVPGPVSAPVSAP